MSDQEELKQHFAQRVIHQAREVLEVWQQLQRSEWNDHYRTALADASQRLRRFAERFEQTEHRQLALAIEECLGDIKENRGRLSSDTIATLSQLIYRLARTGLRHSDPRGQSGYVPALSKPIYIALEDNERANHVVRQLEFFSMAAQAFASDEAFRAAMHERHPAALIMDVDFNGPGEGLKLAERVQLGLEEKLPLIFFSHEETDTPMRLAAVRAGGLEFFTGTIDASSLLEKVEVLTRTAHYEPFRVLIIDDSRAQATHTERVLNNAGIITQTLNEPIQAFTYLAEFQPDLIILDMYMPECLGTELAKVIRQHERYVSVPIIYLSAEDDLEKQLDAMNEGGDDFLTKPIKPSHLIATVRTRAERARNLKARIVRDSLTGLYNHTHSLQLLEDAASRARRDGQPLCFAMIDIDHFKKVNDTYGHPMGDRVIKSLALFLKQRLRKTDHIGRYGGEEFAVVLPNTDIENAVKVLNEIRQRFAEIRYPAQPADLCCTFSCGIAELTPGADTRSLTQQADEALYRAKHGGRNRVERFTLSQG
ncbi:PleD family two-component system response regulator [Pseudomonas stutzeri]|uniref:response regulator n=1 Tax=Stutzerimonas stutzeri TaxID=316 RepID=UPI00210E544A|nr:PleD family two-component system response regulator [Stutzerimonas stutzeri]MCQ4308004.1 PleD family two-component system response regulator [Stutzerimonas stutzeri]